MMKSGNWTRIERLPDTPGAIKMTSLGYVIDGEFTRTVPRPRTEDTPRTSWLGRLFK